MICPLALNTLTARCLENVGRCHSHRTQEYKSDASQEQGGISLVVCMAVGVGTECALVKSEPPVCHSRGPCSQSAIRRSAVAKSNCTSAHAAHAYSPALVQHVHFHSEGYCKRFMTTCINLSCYGQPHPKAGSGSRRHVGKRHTSHGLSHTGQFLWYMC